jgi:hypothetical protein
MAWGYRVLVKEVIRNEANFVSTDRENTDGND